MNTIAYVRATSIYNDSRASKEIKTIAEAGYKVVVLGWDRDGEACEKCKKVFTNSNVTFKFFDVRLPNGIGIKNIEKLFRWIKWVKCQLNGVDKLKAVHACDLDAGIGAYFFCKKSKVPLVYDIFDYYIDCHVIPKFLEATVEAIEIRIINYAEYTIICTEERAEQIEKAKPKNIIVIHNSPEVEELEDIPLEYDYAYCGGLDGRRLIQEILEEYPSHNELKFCFAGFGSNGKLASSLSESYDNFNYFGSVPYGEVIDIEKKSKCLSAIYNPAYRNHQLCAPNKFYEAIALGKPIIACRGTGIDKIIERHELGTVISYDTKEFYDAIQYLIRNPDISSEMGKRGRRLYEERYRWNIMSGYLRKMYYDLLNSNK